MGWNLYGKTCIKCVITFLLDINVRIFTLILFFCFYSYELFNTTFQISWIQWLQQTS